MAQPAEPPLTYAEADAELTRLMNDSERICWAEVSDDGTLDLHGKFNLRDLEKISATLKRVKVVGN